VAPLVFLLIALSLFPGAAAGLKTFFHYDTWLQNLTFRAWWFGELKNGNFATWCPGLFAGYPLFAETQTGPLYPPTFLLFLLLPPPLAFSWSVIVHFMMAGCGAYLAARRLGASRAGAIFTGCTYELSGFLITHVVHFNLLTGGALAPWALAFAYDAWDGKARGFLGLAMTFAFLFLGAHPYALLMTVLLVVLALLFRGGLRMSALLRGGGGAFAALLLGCSLAAVQVLPACELLQKTPRGEAVDYSFLTFGSFPPWQTASIAAPDLFGTPVNGSYHAGPDWSHFAETCAYLGVLPWAFAVCALLLRGDLATRFLVGALSLSFVLMLGKYTPLYRLAAWIPLLQSTRLPSRFSLLFTLALALLAGLGLDALLQERSLQARRRAILVASLLVVLLAAAAWTAASITLSPDPSLREGGQLWPLKMRAIEANGRDVLARLGITVAGALAVLGVLARARVSPRLAVLPVVVAGLDLFTWGCSFNPQMKSELLTEPPPVAAHLPHTAPRPRVFRQGVEEFWERVPGQPRVDLFTPSWKDHASSYATGAWALPPNSQLLYGIDSGEGFTSLPPSQWLEWMGLAGRPGATPRPDLTDGQADLLSIDAVLSSGSGIAGERWQPSALPGDLWVSRNEDPLPRVRLVTSWRTLGSREELLARIRSAGHDPRREALLEDRPPGLPATRAGGRVDEPLEAAELAPGRWSIRVPPAREALVVVAESWDSGWRARAGRSSLPILRVDGLFVGIPAPREGGEVVLEHSPGSVKWGAALSLATLVFLAALVRIRGRSELSVFVCSVSAVARTERFRALAPAFAAITLIVVSWILDVGGWRADREASSIGASAARLWSEEALAATRAGAHRTAETLLQRALARHPDAVTWHRLGVVRRAMGELASAREAFERALAIDPSFEPSRTALSEMRVSPESGSGS
jgi:hypothetical protein